MERTVQHKALQLAGGISRQPPHERFPGQCEDAVNAVFSLVDGASSRPGSIFIKKLTGLASGSIYRLHGINRDANEQYLVLYAINTLRVFHVDGTEATVTGLSSEAATYYSLNSATAAQLRFVSIADYTIIANTTVPLATKATPDYEVTGVHDNYDRMVATTPTSLHASRYVPITNITSSGGFAVFTSNGHGLVAGNTVTISGTNCFPLVSGTYTVDATNLTANTFSVTLAGSPVNIAANGTIGVWSTPSTVPATAGDGTYHRTSTDSDAAPAGHYQYNVGGATFPTIQFGVVTKKPADYATGGTGFDVTMRFEKAQLDFTGYTFTRSTRILRSPSSLVLRWGSTYQHQVGDQIYLAGGTNIVAGWYTIVEKINGWQLRLGEDPTGGAGADARSDVSGGPIGQAFTFDLNNGTGGTLPTMHDVAYEMQRKLQAAGARDALIAWTQVGTGNGYFTVTGPWRGSGAKVTAITTNPTGGLAAAEFNPSGATRIDGRGTGTLSLVVDERWTRFPAPNDPDGAIDATKAPIKMVRSLIGPPATFEYDLIDWSERLSGDYLTNPTPAMFKNGLRISDISFVRQRLMLAAGEGVACSATNDLFRFYLDDANNLVDSDPIGAPLSSDRVTLIEFLTPVQNTVFVTTKAGQQFVMGSPEALTPSTISFTRATRIQTDTVRPCVLGPTLYMVGKAGGKTQLREAFFVEDSVPTDAADVSAHVGGHAGNAGLLPPSIQTIREHANSRQVFVLPSPGGNKIYVYRSHWSGARKEQSAWSVWEFAAGYRISDIEIIDDFLYMLVEHQSQFRLEKVPVFEPAVGSYPYNLHIDGQVEVTGVHSGGTTTWTLPSTLSDTTINKIVKRTGVEVAVASASGTTVTAAGDHSGAPATLGRSYRFSITLTEPYLYSQQIKQDGSVTNSAELGFVMLQNRIDVRTVNTGQFSVIAAPELAGDVTFSFSPASGFVGSSTFTAWAAGDTSRMRVRIESSAVTPTTVAAVTHYGDYGPRIK